MSVNKIYTSEALYNLQQQQSTNPLGSYYKQNRVELLTDEIARNFNTYRNWNEFSLALPKIWDDNGKLTSVSQPQGKGIKSLFSPVAAVYTKEDKAIIRKGMNIPLLDTPENRREIRNNTDCSIRALVNASQEGRMGRAIYDYSDFMFCKYLGRIPNNYMITLRKFPLPCGDHIMCNSIDDSSKNKHMPDIGRLITWIGTPENDMSNILKYKYTIPWQTNEAPLDDDSAQSIGGKEGGGAIGQMFSVLDGSYARQLSESGGSGYDGNAFASAIMGGKGEFGGKSRNIDLKDNNRIVSSRQNAIMKVIVPGGKKEGIDFEQNISITFDYELRSYDGINGRSAMLDLLGNILMVTYLQGKFFEGSYRQNHMSQSSLYTNLDIFKNKGNTSSPMALMNSMFTSIQQAAAGLGFKKGNIKESLKNLGQNLFEVMANGLINKLGRPQQYAMTSLITPTPTGQWHLTVGNPRNPILTIGNLILENAEVEHYGPLGIDDFPTGIKVKVSLKHAKARDSVAIEQMYMQGDSRIYVPMGDKVKDMYDNATYYKASSNSSDLGIATLRNRNSIEDIKNKDNIYLKYFGTRDVQAISVTGGEALVGGEKTNKTN